MERNLPRVRTLVLVALAAFELADGAASAQTTETTTQPQLSVQEIMEGPDFVGTSPSELRWAPDGDHLYFVWKRPDEEREGLYRVARAGGEPERVPDDEAETIEAQLDAVLSEDRSRAAYEFDGGVYILDVESDESRLLVQVPGRVSRVQIAPAGDAVYFVMEDNLFRVDASDGQVRQLTDIRHGSEPSEESPDPHQEFLKQQQRELFDVFREDSIRRAHSWPPPPDTAKVDTPQTFYVEEGQRIGGFWTAPDGRRMAFSLVEEARDEQLAWVPDYVTESGYTEQAPRKRAKVGDDQPAQKLGVMDLVTGAVTWVQHGQDDRDVDLIFREWSDDASRLLAVGISADFHDRWILVGDPETGESRTVDHLHDDAWIGGPAWNQAGWMPDGDRVWFISERTGFAHLYSVAAGGGVAEALTSGPWEVIAAEIAPDEEGWHLVTSEASPHDRHLYRMPLDGGARARVTALASLQGGAGRDIDDVAVSPDGRRLGVLYAWPNRPPELYLQDNESGASPERQTRSTKEAFRAHEWRMPEIVYVPARDGVDVPARLFRPDEPNGAAVIFVHGAGYRQEVHNWWSTYYREYMFNNLLAQRGYTVLDIDYRGSAGYGRDWRTAIHKHMGGKDLTDHIDGASFLVDSLGVAADRIGIYGGSYGGFITLMAMFTQPGVFAAGAALRPVTDWAHYNHWYTARILGLPQDDEEAYRRSSPIYHAEGLEGALLMCHGVIDQNVHFQDTARLAQRLIELEKEDWQVALYPKERHGFVHASSWTDEYRRILELFEDHLH